MKNAGTKAEDLPLPIDEYEYKKEETDNVYDYMMTLPPKLREKNHWMGKGHSKERSKTYPGIAKAMSEQWG